MAQENGEEPILVGGLNINLSKAPRPTKGKVPVQELLGVNKKEDLPEKVDDALVSLQSALEDTLYFWAEFPIIFPPSDLPEQDGREGIISLDNLFVEPTTKNELPSLARGPDGQRKGLSQDQMKELRETGKFSVPSEAFPGSNHVWEVVQWLQKGSKYYHGRHIAYFGEWFNVMYTFPTTVRNHFSSGARKVFWGLCSIPRVLFGFMERERKFPSSRTEDISQARFTQSLIEDLEHIEGNLYKSKSTGLVYDFTLHNPKEWSRIGIRLGLIEGRLNSVWPQKAIQLRAQIEEKNKGREERGKEEEKEEEEEEKEEGWGLKGKYSLTNQEISDLLEQEKEKMLLAEIEKERDFLPVDLILQNYRAMKIVSIAVTKAGDRLEKARKEIRATVTKMNPVRSQCSEWVEKQVEKAVQKEKSELENLPDRILKQLEEEELYLHAYLFSKHLQWKKDRYPAICSELENILVPRHQFELIRYYWSPHSWEVTRSSSGSYDAKKHASYWVHSGYPFWRVINCGIRMFTWWSNFALGLLVSVWCSPFSIRALLYPSPFRPYKRLNHETGELEVDPQEVHTYIYLLRTLWTHVLDSRRRFESEPDSGFLGKSVTRFFNVLYNYVVVGFGGSLFLTATLPPAIILNTLLSLGLFVLSPILGPLLAILGYLCCLLIYDFDGNGIGTVLAWCFRMIFGLVEIIFSLGIAIVTPPVISGVTTIRYLFNKACSVADWFRYQLFIRPFARIPDANGFLIRQVAGPGLRSMYRYQVSPEVVTLALHANLEQKESNWYRTWVNQVNLKPQSHYQRTMVQYFESFGTVNAPILENFLREKSRLIAERLEQELRAHQEKQQIQPFARGVCSMSHLVRQEPAELRRTVALAEQLCSEFFATRLFPYLDEKDLQNFWVNRGLLPGDWESLAKFYLKELFGDQFLAPLEREDEESDPYDNKEIVTLKVHHVNAAAYCDMILTGKPRDPMEKVSEQRKVITKTTSHNPTFWKRCLTGIQSYIPQSVQNVCGEVGGRLRFSALFSRNSIEIQSVTTKTPVLSGHGIRLTISVLEPDNFWIEEPTLNIDGPPLFSALEQIVGGTVMSVGKMFLPLPIESFLNIEKRGSGLVGEEEGEEVVKYVIEVGTGVQGPYSRVKFRDATIISMLNRLISEFDNPAFELVISAKNTATGPMELFRIPVKPSDLLANIQDGVPLPLKQ